MSLTSDHIERAILHAYAAGDLDPARRSAVSAHVEACAACSADLTAIRGLLSALAECTPPNLDDLKWRRIEQAVGLDLEREARAKISRPQHRWWMPGISAAAAAAAVLLVLTLLPREPTTPSEPPIPRRAGTTMVSAVESGATPFEVTLASGRTLELSGHARVEILEDSAEGARLHLQHGQLSVRAPQRVAGARVDLEAPGFTVLADSRDFSVGFWASETFVRVRHGSVRVDGAAFGGSTIVEAGGSKIVRQTQAATVEGGPESGASSTHVAAPRGSHAVSSGPPALAVPATPRARPLTRLASPSAAQTAARHAPEPSADTRVEVIAPVRDPIRDRFVQASRALYEDDDPIRAIELADLVVLRAGERPEARDALELLCQAHIAASQYERAATACTRLLELEPKTERARATHRRLGTLYGEHLSDCSRAVDHYTSAIVFGVTTMLDEGAVLGRARCYVELEKLDFAARDVDFLEQRGRRLARRAELDELKKALDEKRRVQGAR